MVNLLKKPFQDEQKFKIGKIADEKRIPEHFQVNRQRNMPIAKFFGKRGYFLFPSENSYDVYKQNNNDIGQLSAEGVGIPLLHISVEFTSLGSIVGNSPVYMVWKWVLVPADGPPPAVQHEMVAQNGGWCLYKIPFCEIYRNKAFRETEYRLVFPYDSSATRTCMMKRSFTNRDLYTYVDEVSLRWHVPMSIVVNRDHYTLQILDDNARNLLDDPATTKRKKQLKSNRSGVDIGHYTRTYRDSMPHRNSKRANLFIGERSESITYGIADVPWTTQFLACQGLLIQYIEHQRRQDGNEKNGGVAENDLEFNGINLRAVLDKLDMI